MTKMTKKIIINIATQTLVLKNDEQIEATYTVSTAKNGIGSQEGTGCTPLGNHVIQEKIGGDQLINTVFVAREPTGEIYTPELGIQAPERDWILSRILWLAGLEEGINKGTNELGVCDTYERYIYIHGTPDTEPMGTALSFGCVRMRNNDIMELFELVEEGTPVIILEQ